ncbi:hypothetical protein [Leptotrichia trevisanii]|uniref:hypothetical protein n=1 Tax=Leptotrichia trevisanii TaxID=109328 RepID=UPI0026F127F5|nr:hypothetical protein [Leptotrichia trevisanii]
MRTNTYVEIERERFYYIPIEIEEIFKILNYKNKIIITDEKYQNSKKFMYQGKTPDGSIWKLYCEFESCEIIYYYLFSDFSSELKKSWKFKMTNSEIENIKNILIDSLKIDGDKKVYSDVRSEMIFENGKTYYYQKANKKYYKILSQLLKQDIHNIKKN